jgi:hypothetical protein
VPKKGLAGVIGLSGGQNKWELETMVAAIKTGEFDVAFPSYSIHGCRRPRLPF